LTEDEVISPEVVVEPSLAMRKTQQALMPSTCLCESLEYLNRATISSIEVDTWVPRTYIEAMKQPDLWWEPMATKISMLKKEEYLKLCQDHRGKMLLGQNGFML